ncbi:MAG: ABC transporter ATP-binding protein [Woeseiaceae bacterium]|nr:ABC transporter ATP-binding protein [Woeseiaceae bacterium]
MKPLLDVRNLSVVFETRAGDVHAVKDVSYTLQAGESLAVVGESGSGKSVSALSLLGLVPPPGVVTGGQLLFNNRDIRKLRDIQLRRLRGRQISMVFQDPMTSLNPVLTVGQQLIEALVWHKPAMKADARQRAIDTLELVGIPGAADRLLDYPHQFSGGQRQRIMIAMGIICRPSLLIADEPTTALDVTIQAQIVELVKRLQAKMRMAVIWITHDLALVAGIVDKVAVMYAGSIVEYGTVENIFDSPAHPYTSGLLQSMPDFSAPVRSRLKSIDGAPPDMKHIPRGCPFAPRCPRVVDKCRAQRPALETISSGAVVACWRADQS